MRLGRGQAAVTERRQVPAGYGSWWSTELRLWWRDFDAYGHLTATGYPVVYAEAFADYVSEAWNTAEPHFVVADLSVAYLREVRRRDSPVRVHVAIGRVGRASFEATMVLCSADGEVCSTARTRYAAWDPEERRSRPLTAEERRGLEAR
ncbi:thioesterase family protein [Nocardioides maradonensis]